ncbi:MAG: D-alanyl-D-alanine carboxypeptidase/D-alanyl-D-alanine-endopeptidase, partial [Anaerolineae bacterium]|nr:D-alanyl-D-alanine carboxypeptidase/D-alanyl-D-alanine-endopeptidase [Phycisphaerae bacterium]
MKRPFWSAALLLIAITSTFARADLNSDVRAVLQDKALAKAEAGVVLARVDENRAKPEILFRHNSDIALMPASNLKLITTAAFLDRFGPDFKFRTILAQRGQDLLLIGDGDPSFGDAELLKRVGWESTTVFSNWAAMLKKRGLTSVRNVVVDDSIFDENFVHPNWPPKQQHLRYVAGVGGVNFNANALDFYLRLGGGGSVVSYSTDPPTQYATIRNDCLSSNENAVWLSRMPNGNVIDLRGTASSSNTVPISVTIHDPAMFAATVFSETLQNGGIQVSGEPARERGLRALLSEEKSPATQPANRATVLAIHETPIATVLARANKDSMNLYAEAMCKRLGAETSKSSGSWESGTAAVSSFLKSSGIDSSEFSLDDGCGLSRKNAVSAKAMAQILARTFASKNRDLYIASLS